MSPPVLIVSEQLNYTKPDGIHAIFMPVIIEFFRCIGTYLSAKFEYFTLFSPKALFYIHLPSNYLFFILHIACVMVPIGQYTHHERGLNNTIVTIPNMVEVSIIL